MYVLKTGLMVEIVNPLSAEDSHACIPLPPQASTVCHIVGVQLVPCVTVKSNPWSLVSPGCYNFSFLKKLSI